MMVENPKKMLSGKILAGIDDDVILEILLRLPVKSVSRFKCVCKSWKALISHLFFIRNHTLRNPHPITGFFLMPPPPFSTDHPNLEFISFDGLQVPGVPDSSLSFVGVNNSPISILHSCNGLLCCSRNQNYYICNPTTKECVQLPHPTRTTLLCCINLAFDPAKSPHYKAICVRRSDLSSPLLQIEIYSSTTRSWRLSGDAFSAPCICFSKAIFCNGSLNWMGGRDSFYSFDVENELVRSVKLPPVPLRKRMYFGEASGWLYLIGISEDCGVAASFDVFQMKSYESGWSAIHRIHLRVMREICPGMVVPLPFYAHEIDQKHPVPFSVICLLHGEEDEEVLILSIAGRIVSYHIKERVFGKLCDLQLRGVDCVLEAHSLYSVVPLAHTLSSLGV